MAPELTQKQGQSKAQTRKLSTKNANAPKSPAPARKQAAASKKGKARHLHIRQQVHALSTQQRHTHTQPTSHIYTCVAQHRAPTQQQQQRRQAVRHSTEDRCTDQSRERPDIDILDREESQEHTRDRDLLRPTREKDDRATNCPTRNSQALRNASATLQLRKGALATGIGNRQMRHL